MAYSADRSVAISSRRAALYPVPAPPASGASTHTPADGAGGEVAAANRHAHSAVAEYDFAPGHRPSLSGGEDRDPASDGEAPSFAAGTDVLLDSTTTDIVVRCLGADVDRLPSAIKAALRELATVLRAADQDTVSELQATRDQLERALEAARGDVRALRERFHSEYVEARRDVRGLKGAQALVADSRAVQQAFVQIEQVAPTTATVLLLGETGVGKEVFAEAIHELSPRRQKKIVRVNCAAIPTALIESELFGRERGAYTGALSRQIGRFELAEGSTIFLDEIGELPLDVQTKLLRVLQNRVIERLGSSTPIPVNVRIIAATNRDLDQAVAEKTFREDLYYRLNVFPVRVPALRERVEDIPTLVWMFIEEFASSCGKRIESLSKASLHALQTYSWPGNVRELRNVVERAVITAKGPDLVVELPRPTTLTKRRSLRLIDVETDHIRSVLESNAWRVRGRGGAAELLGMKPTTLESRMAKLGIVRPAGERTAPPRDGGRRISIE
jgi:transcriptional regulator with GAF, ATPase, and Fis domain